MNLETLTDNELDMRIGGAYLDNDKAQLAALEAEHDRRRKDEDRQRRAEAERRRRAHVQVEDERVALLGKLTQLRDDYRERFVALLAELDTASDKVGLVATAYEVGRQAYSLSHDLASVTGDRQKFQSRYDVADQLVGHAPREAEAFLSSIRGRVVVVPQPWREDLTRLRELTPQTTGIGNGG